MTPYIPNKSSSRAGRFKKKLVSENDLQTEAPFVSSRMEKILELFRNNEISSSELTALYILLILSRRFPGTWPGSKKPTMQITHDMTFPLEKVQELIPFERNVLKRLETIKNLGEIFNNFALKSTPETVNRALLNWSNGSYQLELMFRIPRPEEVLQQQKNGRRVVTVLTDETKISKYILGERDSLSFTMHDLIHADHFYYHNECYQGQLGFYGLLDLCMKENHFRELLYDPDFEREFEYVIADMNAYAVHLLKCLKSAVIHYHQDGDCFFEHWLKQLKTTESEAEALSTLNTNSYKESNDKIILDYLAKYRAI